jgi:putative spermidine/putrescine transport system ATP-binding protein
MPVAVSLEGVSCFFSSAGKVVRAVDNVSLDVEAGEFFTLLGPSGSGKTTCLRMIGGFALPSAGRVRIHAEDVTLRPPYARPVNTVFQDYALFPHMTIVENVAYALMVRGVAKAQREAKAQQLLTMVQLPDVAQRKPGQLSGGQRQRVALARALISEPKVLLLDEPLGALDLKLREQMQSELKSLQRQLGITFIFVTHDQHEALSMSDRIGIFNQGKIEQIATPTELYTRPRTRFVAEFVGTANVLHGADAHALGYQGSVMLRPERVRVGTSGLKAISGVVSEKQYFGAFWRLQVMVAHQGSKSPVSLLADIDSRSATLIPQVGDVVPLHWDADAVHYIAEATKG